MRHEYKSKHDKILSHALPAEEVDTFHKAKEGNVVKYPFITNGIRFPEFKHMLPKTNHFLEELVKRNELMTGIPFSSTYISIMKPKSSIEKHYGPCNIRLRCNLPLMLPGDSEACFIRVGGELKFWQAGHVIIYDDSYEHESCNLSEEHERVCLIFDIWHPDLMPQERQAITEMFKQVNKHE